MNRFDLFCTLTVFLGFLVGGTSSAFAFQQVDCSSQSAPSCDCSTYSSDNADCDEFDMTNLVEVTDGDEVNDAYAIETQYDDNTDTYIVEARTTTTETELLPVHPNNGVWTNEEATNYINDVLGLNQGGPTPRIPDFLDPDKCSVGGTPLPSFDVSFAGGYERYDENQEQFADTSTRSFIIDLLADPYGNIEIEIPGEDNYRIRFTTPECDEGLSSSSKLKVDQCSRNGFKVVDHGYDGICSEPNDRRPTPSIFWTTKAENLRFKENGIFLETFKGTGAVRSVSGRMRLRNDYYDKNGTVWDSDPKEYQGADAISVSTTEDTQTSTTRGVCGYSLSKFIDDNMLPHETKVTTAEGSVPQPCPPNDVTF